MTSVQGRALAGDAGYKRMIRLVVRAFYAGECPPPPPVDPDAPLPQNTSKLNKALVLVDTLAKQDGGYISEPDLSEETRLSQKQIRRVLKYLSDAGLVRSEAVKYSHAVAGQATDDPEVAGRRRTETRTYWALDYPRTKDTVRLRLALMREWLRKKAEDTNVLQMYICPRCGSQYSSLDAVRLIDPIRGVFSCEECRTELVHQADMGGTTSPGTAKDRQAAARALQALMERQLAPLVEQLERLRDADPPDPGSLQDWFLAQRERAQRYRASLEASRRRTAGGGGGGGGGADEGEGGLALAQSILDVVGTANVEVRIGGGAGRGETQGSAAGGPGAGPAKELPAWFRGEDESLETSGAGGSGPTAAVADAEAQARRNEVEATYIAEYLARVEAQAREAGGGGAGGDTALEDASPDAKRVKLEHAAKEEETTPVTAGEVKRRADSEEAGIDAATAAADLQADFDWEDM